ncbi:MAG: cytochrome P450 [Acidimicrobiales bacterium]
MSNEAESTNPTTANPAAATDDDMPSFNTDPVSDWTSDYDIFDREYVNDPVPVWNDLRGECPIAHTDRWGGSWLPTKHADLQALAKMVPELSSTDPLVVSLPDTAETQERDAAPEGLAAPPITADPPLSEWTRRIILPTFAPKAVEGYRQYTETLCHELIDGFIENGQCDAAQDYAQQIPPRVIAHLLGIDPNKSDDFTTWVRGVLEFGLFDPKIRVKYRDIIQEFLVAEVSARAAEPRDDKLSEYLAMDIPEEFDRVRVVVGIANLLLIAGIDTTWSSIGSALFHFGSHPEDRHRLSADHDMFPTAIEEMLRYYSPVTMARVALEDVEYNGVTFKEGDKVLMNFPGANHDPEVFEDADQILIDRQRNRHIAFGSGIHRCAGSNLARLEMDVALRVWFERIPDFELSDPDSVTWAGGQVRGPRILPMRFLSN